jgi:hypothetical protein
MEDISLKTIKNIYKVTLEFAAKLQEILELDLVEKEVEVKEETESSIIEEKEGWAWPPKLRKAHYFVSKVGEDTGKSLCGDHEYEASNLVRVEFEDESNCIKCSQTLAKREEKSKLVDHLTAPIKESKVEGKVIKDSPGIVRGGPLSESGQPSLTDKSNLEDRPRIKPEDAPSDWVSSMKDIPSEGRETDFFKWCKATNNGKKPSIDNRILKNLEEINQKLSNVNSRSTFEKEEEERNQDPETRSMFQWD